MKVIWTNRAARCAALVTALAVIPLAAAAQSVTVVVNGRPASFDQPPVVQAGRVFVPLRGVFEQLGATVVYSNGQINATARGRTVSLTIGSLQATVGGRPETLDVAPFLIGERTMVPLRFIATALGAGVNWNDSTSTVTIAGGQSGGNPPPPPYPNPRPPVPPPPQSAAALTYHWPTGTIYNHAPQLRFQVDKQVRPASMQVWIDGKATNANISRNDQWYYFASPRALGMGNHTVRVRGITQGGAPFDVRWTFYQAAY
ncbi:MAG TPA: copper amine oxidase N-terminal domain-containing protein [Candidatus Tumulicola sp.]